MTIPDPVGVGSAWTFKMSGMSYILYFSEIEIYILKSRKLVIREIETIYIKLNIKEKCTFFLKNLQFSLLNDN